MKRKSTSRDLSYLALPELTEGSAEELTERFIRGDLSRSTEGSGLGLSIAKTLTTMMGGTFDLYLDGDLFKVVIIFDKID